MSRKTLLPLRKALTTLIAASLLAFAAPVAAQPEPGTTEAPAPAETTEAPKNKNKNKDEEGTSTVDAPTEEVEEPGAKPSPPKPSGPSAAEILEMTKKYDEALAGEAEALARYEIAAVSSLQAESALNRAQAAERRASRDLNKVTAKLRLANKELEEIRQEFRETAEQLRAEQERLKNQAIEAFIGAKDSAALTAITQAMTDDYESAASAAEYADVVLQDQTFVVLDVTALKAELAELRKDQSALVLEISELRKEKTEVLAERTTAREETESAAETAAILLEEEKALLAAAQTGRANYELTIGNLASVSDSVSATLRRTQLDQPPAVTATRFHSPLDEVEVSSGFGPRVHPIFGGVRMHNGLDYGGSYGDPIYAAAAGTVVMAELRGGYGNVVVIDHGNRLGTVYAHQSQIDVVVGEVVYRGQQVGSVGSTGNSTGPHLHFEVRVTGNPVDPYKLIDFDEIHPVPCATLKQSYHPADVAVGEDPLSAAAGKCTPSPDPGFDAQDYMNFPQFGG